MAWGVVCEACGSDNIVGVEYPYGHPQRYDGISEWLCKNCGRRTGRWTGNELREGEVEERYGRSDAH